MPAIDVLLVRIEADLSDLKRELDKGSRAVDDASKKMVNSTKGAEAGFSNLGRTIGTVVSIALVAGLARAGKAALDAAGDLGELADSVGLTTDAFQELVYAGSQVGLSQGQLTSSFAIFSRTIGDASNGNAQAIKTYRDLGVTILDANGKLRSNDSILNSVADAISKIPDPARRTAVAMDLFGRSGAKLIPLLQNGAKGLADFKREAHALGLVLSGEDIAAADEASDKIKTLEQAFSKLAQTIAAQVAPALTYYMNLLQSIVAPQADVLKELMDIGKEIDEIDKRAASRGARPGPAGILRGAEDAKLRAELIARRQQLIDANQGAPPGETGGGGSNPLSDAAVKLREQMDMQLRLAQVMGSTTEEIERQRFAIEARSKAVAADLSGPQLEQYVQTALKVYDLTEAEKARFEGIKAGNEHLQENIEKELKIIEFKEKLLTTTQREVDDNERLIAALQKGTKEYERELALIQLINRAKDAKADLTEEEIESYKKLADTIGEQRDQLDQIKDGIDANKRASQDFAHVIGTAFEDSILEGKKLGDILKSLEQDIARIILRMTVTKPLENMLTGSGSSGGGDLFGGIFKSISGLFSGGGGGETGSSFFGDSATSFNDISGGFAAGGNPPVGKASMVGERGPELFVPKTPGTIISNDNLKGMGGSTFYIDARGADNAGLQRLETTVREMNGTIERRSVSAVLEHKRRNPAAFA